MYTNHFNERQTLRSVIELTVYPMSAEVQQPVVPCALREVYCKLGTKCIILNHGLWPFGSGKCILPRHCRGLGKSCF